MGSSNQRKLPSNSSLLDPSFGIPSDITFQIMGFNNPDLETVETGPEEIILGEVRGHKIILGLVSPVFRRGFFGPAKETKDIVPVRETTLEAFNMMVDYMYSNKIDWNGQSVLELYDVVNLAEKYDIPGLLEEIQTQMKNLPLAMEDVMEVADTAFQFSQFPNVSNQLLLNCAKFVKTKMKTSASLLQFATDQAGSGQEATVLRLMTLMRDPLPVLCPNCKQEKCQDGKLVDTLDQLIAGCKLAVNKQNRRWGENGGDFCECVFTVVTVDMANKTISVDYPGATNHTIYIHSSHIPLFCYKCV